MRIKQGAYTNFHEENVHENIIFVKENYMKIWHFTYHIFPKQLWKIYFYSSLLDVFVTELCLPLTGVISEPENRIQPLGSVLSF